MYWRAMSLVEHKDMSDTLRYSWSNECMSRFHLYSLHAHYHHVFQGLNKPLVLVAECVKSVCLCQRHVHHDDHHLLLLLQKHKTV